VQDLNQALAESFGINKPGGALVSHVAAGSAAANAGLKAGDVIVEVNGEDVQQAGALSSLIGLAAPGEKVSLKVWRDHALREVQAKLGAGDDGEEVAADTASSVTGGQLGLALRPLTREERQQAQLDQGLVVDKVSGAAARAGIEAGDVLLAVNGQPVESAEQLRGLLKNKPKRVALLVQRDGEKIFVPVILG